MLWAINELVNLGKHEVLAPSVVVARISKVDHFGSSGLVIRATLPPRWDHDRGEMELAVMAHGAQLRYGFDLQAATALGHLDFLRRTDAATALRQMSDKVDAIVSDLDACAGTVGIW